MAGTAGCDGASRSGSLKAGPSSDWGLQPAPMKSELLVIDVYKRQYFFRVFAISGLLCMGASFRIDALGDEIWLFQLGMWIEAVSAWIRGYISLVGFWYTPRGYRGV